MKIVICGKVLDEAWTFHHAVGGGGTVPLHVTYHSLSIGWVQRQHGRFAELVKVQCGLVDSFPLYS